MLTHHLIIVVCVKETVKYKDQRLERDVLPSNNRSVSSAELPGSIRSFKVKKEDFYSHLDSFLVLQNRQKVLKVAAAA